MEGIRILHIRSRTGGEDGRRRGHQGHRHQPSQAQRQDRGHPHGCGCRHGPEAVSRRVQGREQLLHHEIGHGHRQGVSPDAVEGKFHDIRGIHSYADIQRHHQGTEGCRYRKDGEDDMRRADVPDSEDGERGDRRPGQGRFHRSIEKVC